MNVIVVLTVCGIVGVVFLILGAVCLKFYRPAKEAYEIAKIDYENSQFYLKFYDEANLTKEAKEIIDREDRLLHRMNGLLAGTVLFFVLGGIITIVTAANAISWAFV